MLQSAMLQRWSRTTHKKDKMKLGKLIYDNESGEARVKFNKKFHFDLYGYEQLDVIKDLQECLDGWYKSILEDEMMEGDEIACSQDDEDAEYGPPIN